MMLSKRKRVVFVTSNEDHVKSFKQFLAKGRWGKTGCPFELEYPWVSIPDMIKDKLVRHYLNVRG